MISNKTSKMLRGLAILIVIASHYAGWMYVDPVHVKAHDWISSWGPVGVDIFFLMSGYGLVKSAKKSGITPLFVLKRFLGAYMPYMIILLTVSAIQHDFADMDKERVIKILIGYDYWYMEVLFIMYIMFMVIFKMGEYGKLHYIRIPLISAGVIYMTYVLYNKGYADFWELSNVAFLIGIYAAIAEEKFAEIMSKKMTKAILGIIGIIGFAVCLRQMGVVKLVDPEAVFGWELTMNIFFDFIVLSIAMIIPTWKGYVLPALGESSLFIYMLHTAMFWAIVFKFENMNYAGAASLTALITLCVATVLGMLYNRLTGLLLKRSNKA